MKIGKMLATCIGLGCMFLTSIEVSAASYLYNQDNEAVESPDAYEVTQEISLEADGIKAVSPQDVFYSDSGQIYIVDTKNNRVLFYDKEYELAGVLSEFKMQDGTASTLLEPEGIFVDWNETLYVADTGNHRIIKCDRLGNVLLQIEKPQNLIGIDESASFNPTKVAVDKSGRIYVVARNYNLGILQLDKNGEFVGYVGAPKVQYNLVQMLWRKISTEEQLAKMEQYVPTEYNNITIDDEGFIYGSIGTLDAKEVENTISTHDTSGMVTPIKKLNTVGKDVLKRNGFAAPMGDLEYEDVYSKIVDITYTTGGRYAMLDSSHNHVFVYDSNSNLLCAFGNDSFVQLSSFVFMGESLAILEAQGAKLYVYEPTNYGQMISEAVLTQYNGDFDAAYALWSDVAAYNYNFEYAFIGLGKSYIYNGEYEEAMECYQRVGDKENYSRAKEYLRKEQMKTAFPVIFFAIISIAGLSVIWSVVKKVNLYIKGGNGGKHR